MSILNWLKRNVRFGQPKENINWTLLEQVRAGTMGNTPLGLYEQNKAREEREAIEEQKPKWQ